MFATANSCFSNQEFSKIGYKVFIPPGVKNFLRLLVNQPSSAESAAGLSWISCRQRQNQHDDSQVGINFLKSSFRTGCR